MTVHTFRYFHRTCQPKFFDTELPTWQQLRRCHIQVGVHTLSCTVSLPDPLLPTCSGKGATTIPPLAHDDRACSSSEPKEIHFGTLKVLGLYVRSTSVAYMPIRTPPRSTTERTQSLYTVAYAPTHLPLCSPTCSPPNPPYLPHCPARSWPVPSRDKVPFGDVQLLHQFTHPSTRPLRKHRLLWHPDTTSHSGIKRDAADVAHRSTTSQTPSHLQQRTDMLHTAPALVYCHTAQKRCLARAFKREQRQTPPSPRKP